MNSTTPMGAGPPPSRPASKTSPRRCLAREAKLAAQPPPTMPAWRCRRPAPMRAAWRWKRARWSRRLNACWKNDLAYMTPSPGDFRRPPTSDAPTALNGSNRPSAVRHPCQDCVCDGLLAAAFDLARTGTLRGGAMEQRPGQVLAAWLKQRGPSMASSVSASPRSWLQAPPNPVLQICYEPRCSPHEC